MPDVPPPEIPDLTAAIVAAAAEPAVFSNGSETVTAHPLPDLIAAQQFLADQAAAAAAQTRRTSGWGQLGRTRAVLPGAGP